MLKTKLLVLIAILSLSLSSLIAGGSYMTKGVKEVKINLNGEKFTIKRSQKKGNTISKLYETTFRGTIQPILLAKGVETVGELEFIEYMKKAQHDKSIIIVDSRKPGWHERLRIPGSVNMPFTDFNDKDDADSNYDDLGVTQKNGKYDFSKAKTIVAYCNGYWCAQTPGMFRDSKYSLLKVGYPASKMKYYRGGMQAWTSLGLTVVGSGK
jgi:rhodanese-related sulfurtransferase